ncbi:vesicular, overexpressed in cancer, prosurvival protein 1 isoform X1 [Pteropus alecto]|uniref:vesicular, overexpressed in cancer, prosurvival protein 1 isoform X1 n=1 Tax=Pteropus alecto TaxID=9402 RepID=UPI000D5368A7|nr:vesicular, overexpressed in cancer, prosurvival protein 1 isoform X1 [Pteropus alecto]XP_024902622.1 vesicular, overexpressed in cancer, prosurvival protein 1 isoform X1 [Pteropus alecto]
MKTGRWITSFTGQRGQAPRFIPLRCASSPISTCSEWTAPFPDLIRNWPVDRGMWRRCRPYEDCCGSRCCVRALSIQRLWYFWRPAAGTAVLHGPRRTRGECAWEPCGHGFPGPAQLAPGRHGLPATSFLLQHAPAPLRTGGEGQVAGAPGACLGDAAGAGRGLSRLPSPSPFASRMIL